MQRYSWLGKLITLLGGAILIALVLGIAGEVYYHLRIAPLFQAWPFDPVAKISSTCGSLALAYFCLFVGALFKQIEKKEGATPKRIENFCALTCFFFAVSGAIGLFEYLRLFDPKSMVGPLGTTQLMVWIGLILDVFLRLGPFIYSAVIAVLYRHFTALIKFESEEVV